MQHKCKYIRNHNAKKNRNNLEHSLTPDVKHNNDSKCNDCDQPIGRSIVDCRWCKAQSDTDNNRSGYNRRKETHHAFHANQLNDECKYQIQQSCNEDTATRIL